MIDTAGDMNIDHNETGKWKITFIAFLTDVECSREVSMFETHKMCICCSKRKVSAAKDARLSYELCSVR